MNNISVNGREDFTGRMLIHLAPAVKDVPPFIEGPCDWRYDSESNTWHSNAHSYSAASCTPLFDEVAEI